MARFESQKRMGYYRTPEGAQAWLCDLLTTAEGPVHIIDPCCGEGIALEAAGKKLNAVTYGVELDGMRYEESGKRLNNVLHCSALEFTCSKESFGLMWLNPPYDDDFRTGGKARRLEATFYFETQELLAPGGILVYLVPDYIMNEGLAKSLCYRFEELKVFRFPKDEYRMFKQVAIIGKKRPRGIYDPHKAEAFIGKVLSAPCMDDAQFDGLLPVPSTEGPRLFRDVNPSVEEMARELPHSPLQKELRDFFIPVEQIAALSPMMPLSRGHLATLLTAGIMNGRVEKDGKAIVVKGYTKRVKDERQEVGEDNRVKVITVDHTRVSVRFFNRDGLLHNVV